MKRTAQELISKIITWLMFGLSSRRRKQRVYDVIRARRFELWKEVVLAIPGGQADERLCQNIASVVNYATGVDGDPEEMYRMLSYLRWRLNNAGARETADKLSEAFNARIHVANICKAIK